MQIRVFELSEIILVANENANQGWLVGWLVYWFLCNVFIRNQYNYTSQLYGE